MQHNAPNTLESAPNTLESALRGLALNDERKDSKVQPQGGKLEIGPDAKASPSKPPRRPKAGSEIKKPTQRIACKNCPAGVRKWYKGTEPSPNGLGYSAAFADVNTRMIGNNGMWWVVKANVNGVHAWRKEASKSV